MIPVHLEPKGLAPDAEPFADDEPAVRLADAARGSADLRDAILTCMGLSAPIRLPYRRPRSPIATRNPKLARPQKCVDDLLPCHFVRRLQRRIAEHYEITVEQLLSPTKKRTITLPRQAGMFLLRQMTDKSYPDIAHLFGLSDHTTAMHAVRRIEELRSRTPELDAALKYLSEGMDLGETECAAA